MNTFDPSAMFNGSIVLIANDASSANQKEIRRLQGDLMTWAQLENMTSDPREKAGAEKQQKRLRSEIEKLMARNDAERFTMKENKSKGVIHKWEVYDGKELVYFGREEKDAKEHLAKLKSRGDDVAHDASVLTIVKKGEYWVVMKKGVGQVSGKYTSESEAKEFVSKNSSWAAGLAPLRKLERYEPED